MKGYVKALLVFGIIFIICVVGYSIPMVTTSGMFLYNTYINGVDCSLMTPEQANEVYTTQYYPNMNFDIIDSEGKKYSITYSMFDFSDAEKTDELLEQVNRVLWIKSLKNETHFTTTDGGVIAKLQDSLDVTLPIMDKSTWTDPENAYIEYSTELGKYVIVPEKIGTKLNKEKFYTELIKHIKTGSGDFKIEDIEGLYTYPEITKDNDRLNALLNAVNTRLDTTVTYDVKGNVQVFNSSSIVDYIDIDNTKLDFTFDIDKCTEDFIKKMASHYNTLGISREFKTSVGDTVTVDGGDWGWWLNQKKSIENLKNQIEKPGKYTGELVWLQEADYGELGDFKNYVEIDITNQHVYMYKDGALVVEGDVVTGNMSAGNGTREGTFSLTYKTRNDTLNGPGYSVFVKYWMPFDGGIGMHDASWRYKFGGNIYKTNGSHGCVNMPEKVAQTIYENIDKTYAIIAYYR